MLNRSKQHFEKVLNRDDSPMEANISSAEENLDINLFPSFEQEFRLATKKLKNVKAPGTYGVQAELLKPKRKLHP